MKRIPALLMAGVVLLTAASAPAQSLLERLEKRLGNLADRVAEQRASEDERPAAGGEDAAPRDAASDRERAGYLGVIVDEEDNQADGVRVLNVKPESAAEQAGIRAGDLIVAINGRPIRGLADMSEQLADVPAGARITIKVMRAGQEMSLLVTMGRRADAEQPLETGDGEVLPSPLELELGAAADPPRPSLGVTVRPLTDDSRRRYGLNVTRGALVTSVRSGSPADRAGLPLGAVIVAMDGQRVDEPRDLLAVLSEKEVGDRVELTYYEGDRLTRETVALSAPAEPRPPALPRLEGEVPADPSPLRGRGRADRPLLGRLEQALEGFVQPPEGQVPPAPTGEIDRLRQEVESLRRHIGRLEERLEALEQKAATQP